MKRNSIYLLILFSSMSFALEKDLAPIDSNDNEFSLDMEVVEQADDTRAYVKYLKDSGIFQDLVFQMKMSLAPFTKEITREVDTFNYRKRKTIDVPEISELKSKEGLEYAQSWRDAIFKHLPDESGYIGWGLYTAANPSSSRDGYTGNQGNFSLFKVTMPKKTRFLDIRYPKKENLNIPIQESLYKKLKSICPTIHFKGNRYNLNTSTGEKVAYRFINKTDLTRDKKCHDIFVQAIQELNIGAIKYRWGRPNLYPDFCSGKNDDHKTAFVIVNLPLTHANVSTFTNKVKDPREVKNNPEYSYIFSGLRRFHSTGEEAHIHYPNWIASLSVAKSRRSLAIGEKNYIKRHSYVYYDIKEKHFITDSESKRNDELLKDRIIGCNDKFKEEDNPVFEITRAQALFIQEVVRRTKTKTVKEANEILGDCYKTDESVFIDPEKDADIAEVLSIVGDLLEKK